MSLKLPPSEVRGMTLDLLLHFSHVPMTYTLPFPFITLLTYTATSYNLLRRVMYSELLITYFTLWFLTTCWVVGWYSKLLLPCPNWKLLISFPKLWYWSNRWLKSLTDLILIIYSSLWFWMKAKFLNCISQCLVLNEWWNGYNLIVHSTPSGETLKF